MTATKRQLAAMDGRNADLEEEGNPATQITLRWRCKLNACRNWKGDLRGLCYVDGERDIFENHLPIKSEHLLSWSAAIAVGTSSSNEPPRKTYKSMIEARISGRARHGESLSSTLRRQSDSQSQGPFQQTQHFHIGTGSSPLDHRRAPSCHSPSPPLVSSQGVLEDHIVELFT